LSGFWVHSALRSKNSSFGWDPAKKRKEIFHSLSRFILVYDKGDTLLAFVMFRFEHENDEDMVYWYTSISLCPVALLSSFKAMNYKSLRLLKARVWARNYD
jgi:hypothetical protein